ncbi:MAG: DNA polymerase III subunit epsilon [Pseudomonadales bacterium]|nr:DNA polymerase III subunit epsilon [Pseudomonadales bacterium]
MRQVVLDTETTGLEVGQGHRVIEIGAVELVGRKLTGRHFHRYLNPERDVDDGAYAVHGLSREFLADKPRFADVAQDFLAFVTDAELIIHNAPFDLAFLDQELARVPGAPARLADFCRVTDSLALARHKHPGQKNNLDALCRRYQVDNSARDLHGALLDAEILADVYLAMTGGQTLLFGAEEGGADADGRTVPAVRRLAPDRPPLAIVRASVDELGAHERLLDLIDQRARGGSVWRRDGAGG